MTGVTALAIAHPWAAAVIALALLVIGAILVYTLASRIRRYNQRYDAWGEQVGISASPPARPARTVAAA